MNEIIEKGIIDIEDKIFEIIGVQVMLSSVVAKLYHVETKRLEELFDKYNPIDITLKVNILCKKMSLLRHFLF